MSFRDDHDATLARADALERDNAKLRERAAELEADLKEARKPAPRPHGSSRERNVAMVMIVVSVVLLFVVIGLLITLDSPKRQSAATPAGPPPIDAGPPAPGWNDVSDRWQGLHALLHCQRNGVNRLAPSEIIGDTVYDPRGSQTNYGEWITHLTDNGCADELARAANDRKLPADARAALKAWHDADAVLDPFDDELGMYYYNRDFVDDDLGAARAKWPELMRLVAANRAALVEVGRVARPAIRDDVRATLTAHEGRKGRDEAYWRGTLHLALDELNEVLYLEPPDLARVQHGAAALRALSAEAPVEVRRSVRPVIEALNALGAPGEGSAATLDLVPLRGPVFNALFEVTPGRYPEATL